MTKVVKQSIERKEAATVSGFLLADAFEEHKTIFDGSSKEDVLSREFWELMAHIHVEQETAQSTMCKCLKEIFLPQMELRCEDLKIAGAVGDDADCSRLRYQVIRDFSIFVLNLNAHLLNLQAAIQPHLETVRQFKNDAEKYQQEITIPEPTKDDKKKRKALQRKSTALKGDVSTWGEVAIPQKKNQDAEENQAKEASTGSVANKSAEATVTKSEPAAPLLPPLFGEPLADAIARSKLKNPQLIVPDVLYEAFKFLEETGLKTVGLFRVAGDRKALAQVKQQIDETHIIDFSSSQDHVACGIIKQYLRDLPVPLCTFEFAEEFLYVASIDEKREQLSTLKELIDDSLPRENAICLGFVISNLLKIIAH